jgi:hypothetical protein
MARSKDGLTPVDDEELAGRIARLGLPRAWPDDDTAFRHEVRQRLTRIEAMLEVLLDGTPQPPPAGSAARARDAVGEGRR